MPSSDDPSLPTAPPPPPLSSSGGGSSGEGQPLHPQQPADNPSPPAPPTTDQLPPPSSSTAPLQPPSSNPAPQADPPTPGPRALRLRELYHKSLSRTLSRIDWPNFAACYPTIAAHKPATLQSVQAQMVARLGVLCEREFEAILEARGVVEGLNELEELVRAAGRRREEEEGRKEGEGWKGEGAPVPPHLLPPTQILHAHLARLLAQHQSQLNARLQTTQTRNAQLWEEIAAQRRAIAAALDAVDVAVTDVVGASGLLSGVGGEEGPDGSAPRTGAGLVDQLVAEAAAVEREIVGLDMAQDGETGMTVMKDEHGQHVDGTGREKLDTPGLLT